MTNHVATVKRIYERFGRGDIDGILAELDPAVEWATISGVPAEPPKTSKKAGLLLRMSRRGH